MIGISEHMFTWTDNIMTPYRENRLECEFILSSRQPEPELDLVIKIRLPTCTVSISYVKYDLQATMTAQVLSGDDFYPRSPNPQSCPARCFNANALVVFELSTSTAFDPAGCICDPQTIQVKGDVHQLCEMCEGCEGTLRPML